MKKLIKIKYLWIALNFLLLAVPVFVPSTNVDVIGICFSIPLILSYPLGILAGLIFFGFDLFDDSIGTLYLMMFVFSVLAYVQWFVLVPRLSRFIKQRFFRKDVKINLIASVESVQALPVHEPELDFESLRKNWYDEQRRTPVERVFNNEND